MRPLAIAFFALVSLVPDALAQNQEQNAMSVSAGTLMSEAQPGHDKGCCKKPADGVTKKYFTGTEKVRMETTFLNGKENGVQRLYFENGNLRMETTFVDGKPHGAVKRYYEDGTLEEESTFVNGEIQGEAKLYEQKSDTGPK